MFVSETSKLQLRFLILAESFAMKHVPEYLLLRKALELYKVPGKYKPKTTMREPKPVLGP